MNRSLTLSLVAGALALGACSGDPASNNTQAPEPDDVVARVNGNPISAVALDAQIQSLASRGQSPDRGQALEQLIDLQLLTQQAEDSGLTQQPEIAAEVERQRAAILARHVIRAELSDFEPSEDDLRQAYQDRVEGMGGAEFRASHILVETQEKAGELIAQLDEGAEFGALAEEHSTGPTASRQGDLGWFKPNQMVPPFAEAVQQLEPGDYTPEPVETQFGWHVIHLAETREAEKPAYEDMKSEIRNELASQHIQDYLGSLREQAEVEVSDSSLEDASNAEMPAAADVEADKAAGGQ